MPTHPTVPTLPGVTSEIIPTPRLAIHALLSGPERGVPVVFIHGNFSAATWWEETMLALPSPYRCVAPDLRGYGDTEDLPIDATRGARDWSDDLEALRVALDLGPIHLVGWSLGGAVVMQYTLDHPERVASLTLVAPASPYGWGGVKGLDGAPCHPDHAGSGGGLVNPEMVRRIREGDRSTDDPSSPRSVLRALVYKPPFIPRREEALLSASLLERVGPDRYPGDSTPSDAWPHLAPGKWGPINAISSRWFNASALAELPRRPPVLWVRGEADPIVSDASMVDVATLGQLGLIPGWPGPEVFPPQPMVSQTRAVLDRYRGGGGHYRELVLEGVGHSPPLEAPEAFTEALLEHLRGAGGSTVDSLPDAPAGPGTR